MTESYKDMNPRIRRLFSRWVFPCACLVVIAAILTPSIVPWPSSRTHVNEADRRLVSQLLQKVEVVALRPRILGYERSQFGSGWQSTVDSMGTTLTTRQLVLQRANNHDEYTGKPDEAEHMDIDHIYPLAAAWDMGAWSWKVQQRIRFANDVERNLVATDSSLNRDKSDSTPGDWLPPEPASPCYYVRRFLSVAVTYGLAVSADDAAAARQACTISERAT